MSFNSRNFNPNIWETPRQGNPQPFNNNSPNFFANNLIQFPRQSFYPQNNQFRPLLSLPGPSAPFENRRFNSNQEYQRNNNRGRNNFQSNNQQKRNKDSRKDDFFNRDARPNDAHENFINNNNHKNERVPTDGSNDSHSTEGPRPKSLVEQLKSTMRKSDQHTDSSNEMIEAAAKNTSRKLLSQLKSVDKDNVKELINNPKQPHKRVVMNMQAREKLREGMRKQLKTLGAEDENDVSFDVEETIDSGNIPETLIAQISRTVGMELGTEDMDLQHDFVEEISEDKDIEVIKQNLGNDFLMGSEMLLMNGFSLLGENEQEVDADERIFPPPPLPPHDSKPPEPQPVPPPSESASLTSISTLKSWSPPRRDASSTRSYADDDWDYESAKNPDPPQLREMNKMSKPPPTEVNAQPIQVIVGHKPPSHSANVAKNENHNPILAAVTKTCEEKPEVPATPRPDEQFADTAKSITSTPIVPQTPGPEPELIDWSKVDGNQPKASNAQDSSEQQNQEENPNEKRANETYGEYRRRTMALQKQQQNFNKPRPQHPNQQKRTDNDEEKNNRPTDNNWVSNNKRNNNETNRKSRFEANRPWNRNNNNNNNNRNEDRSSSRELNSSRERFEEMRDPHNYRFDRSQNDTPNSTGDIDNLNSILNPKQFQFKGSFKKRSNFAGFNASRDFDRTSNRSQSRERTPANNSVEREFGPDIQQSAHDVRPCFHTLKKIMEIDVELTRVRDKILGIDKVILNLQSERVGYNKKLTTLEHDRKVLFDNLIKRVKADDGPSFSANESAVKERDKSKEKDREVVSQKTLVNKKLQDIVEQRKRKNEEPVASDEPKKKFKLEEEPKTAAQKQKEKEEEDRKRKIAEIKRQKQLRRERQEAERKRLEEEAKKESGDIIPVIKKERRTSVETPKKQHTHSNQNLSKSHSTEKAKNHQFKSSDIIQASGYKIKIPRIEFFKLDLMKELVDDYTHGKYPEIMPEQWDNWMKSKLEKRVKKDEPVTPSKTPNNESEACTNGNDPAAATTSNDVVEEKDPLMIDDHENMDNPPTPGSSLTMNEDSIISNELDYSEWVGEFNCHDLPIVHLQNIDGKYMVCAAEDGKLYKYAISSGKLESIFTKHTEICNYFMYDEREHSIYTASSDGIVYRIKYKNFQSIGSRNFEEPLQVIEKSKNFVYIGSKSGKILKLKFDLSDRDIEPLCSVDALILCLRATKEGTRNTLLVSSRANAIQVRDANDGLLLRTLSSDMVGVSIYDMLIDGSTIYCGSNLHEIFAIDFTTGALINKRAMNGAGAICVKLYKNYLIAACYDGNIYIFDVNSDDDAVNITGPSNMLLAMDLWNDKIIASTKDKTLKIINIPT